MEEEEEEEKEVKDWHQKLKELAEEKINKFTGQVYSDDYYKLLNIDYHYYYNFSIEF